MKAPFLRICGLALVASLAACSTTGGGGRNAAEVTRFHLGQQVARGQIAIEPFGPGGAESLEFRTYADAVARQLTRLGWTVVNTVGQSEQVALIDFRQGTREALARRSPVSIGLGGSTGSYGGGVGGGISFGLGGGRSGAVVGSMMEVSIKRRSDGTVFWEGRGRTEARERDPEAQPAIAAEKLADALFRDFPGPSGVTIRVP
jgi:hypothetical protein